MSQHWHHEGKHSFYLGWDKPLQGFFLVVYPKHDPRSERPEHLWSNLDLAESHPKTFAGFAQVMEQYGAPPPAELLANLVDDKRTGRAPKHPLANLFG